MQQEQQLYNKMIIDQKNFFSNYINSFGRIYKDETVATISGIVNEATRRNLSVHQTAYILATAYHEAKDRKYFNDFHPIIERGSWDYIVKQYWYNSRVRKWLGNDTKEESWKYRGRGLVQITGENNYEKFNLQDNPDEALKIDVAIKILFDGMLKGIFTGAKLSKYINDYRKDYVGARRTVNGTDKAELIAGYAIKFEDILCRSLANK